MLTAATLGMFLYGVYSAGSGLVDLLWWFKRAVWADLAFIFFGSLLIVAAALVRVLIPGSVVLAIGAMLGLQALAIQNEAHAYGRVIPLLQAIRALFAAGLVLFAYYGARRTPPLPG